MQKTSKEVWCIEPVVSPVLQVHQQATQMLRTNKKKLHRFTMELVKSKYDTKKEIIF